MLLLTIAMLTGVVLLWALFVYARVAMSEVRVVRLEQLQERGNGRAKQVLRLHQDEAAFTAVMVTGTVGCSLLLGGLLAGGLLPRVPPLLPAVLPPLVAQAVAWGGVLLLVGVVVVVGAELLPRLLAQHHPEGVLLAAAPLLVVVFVVVGMPARLLTKVVNTLAAPFVRRTADDEDSEKEETFKDDIREAVREGAQEGFVKEQSEKIFEALLRLDERTARQIMTPRVEMVLLRADDAIEDVLATVLEESYSRYPVYGDNPDDILGFVHIRDLLELQHTQGAKATVGAAIEHNVTTVVGENTPASSLLTLLRQGRHIAIVVDEYSVLGLVTLEDVLEELVGDIADEHDDYDYDDDPVKVREDGSFLMDGRTLADEVKRYLALDELPGEEHYQTLAGLLLTLMGTIPSKGQYTDWAGWRFEVMDMDGRRIDQVLVSALEPTTQPETVQ